MKKMLYKRLLIRKPKLVALEIVMIVFTIIYFLPFYIILTISMKTPQEALKSTFSLPESFHIGNLVKAWHIINFEFVLINTILISFFTVIGIILLAAMASFTIAKQVNSWNGFLYYFFLSGLMIPIYTILVPLLQLTKNLQMMDSQVGLIIVYIGHGMPFAIFLLVGFIRGVPKEIMEAGTIDGCNIYQLFGRIVLPMLQPVIVTLFILDIIWIWNDFLLPMLMLQSKSNFTITLSQYALYGEFETRWEIAFSGFLLAIAPLAIIYLSLQKYVIKGISAGALKG